jgi:hypothetical protein
MKRNQELTFSLGKKVVSEIYMYIQPLPQVVVHTTPCSMAQDGFKITWVIGYCFPFKKLFGMREKYIIV